MSRQQIEEAIPHRDPFLFVDEIVEWEESRIVCKKTFSGEEEFFKGGRRSDRATSAVLEEEMAQRGTVPPPPPADEGWAETPAATEAAPAYSEEAKAAPAPAYTEAPAPAPAPEPAAGASCPDCGNAMAPSGPSGGRYCPMCGYQEPGS